MSVTRKIQVRRGTASQWSTANPVLSSGEFGYDTTNKVLKIGDGSTAWASLAEAGLSETDIQDLIDTSLADYATTADVNAALASVPTLTITTPTVEPEPNRNFGFYREYVDIDAYQNIVESWGYNYDRANTSEPSMGLTIESKFLLNNVGPFVTELHMQGRTIEGTAHRDFVLLSPRSIDDKLTGSLAGFNTTKFILFDFDANVKIQCNWDTNTVLVADGVTFTVNGGSYAPFRMRNAAEDAFLDLPYYDSANRLRLPGTVRMQGGHSTADGQNSCFHMQGLGTFPNNASVLEILGPSSNGNNLNLIQAVGSASFDCMTTNYNTANTSVNNKSIFNASVNRADGKAFSRYFCVLQNAGFDVGYDGATSTFKVAFVTAFDTPSFVYMDITRASNVPANSVATFYGHLSVVGSQITMAALPTTDPSVPGRLWRDGTTVKVSV